MAAITIFRGLIITALAVFAAEVVTGVMAYFGPEVPAAVQSYLAAKNTGTLANVFSEANLGTQIAVGILMVLYLVAFIAALIGLLGFRRWARWLFIIVTSLTLIFLASGGMTHLHFTRVTGLHDQGHGRWRHPHAAVHRTHPRSIPPRTFNPRRPGRPARFDRTEPDWAMKE